MWGHQIGRKNKMSIKERKSRKECSSWREYGLINDHIYTDEDIEALSSLERAGLSNSKIRELAEEIADRRSLRYK